MSSLKRQLQSARGKDRMRAQIDALADEDRALLLVHRADGRQTIVQCGVETVAVYVYLLHEFLFGELHGDFDPPEGGQ